MKTVRSRLALMFLCGLTTRGMVAQSNASGASDSAAILVVVSAALKALAANHQIDVSGSAPSPWLIRADDLTPAWRTSVKRLYQILNARPHTAKDTAFSVLHFGPMRISNDTLTASFEIGSRWRACGVMMASSAWH